MRLLAIVITSLRASIASHSTGTFNSTPANLSTSRLSSLGRRVLSATRQDGRTNFEGANAQGLPQLHGGVLPVGEGHVAAKDGGYAP
jgi:hypothetical protein